MVTVQDLETLRKRYVSALLAGDAGKARQAVSDAQNRGLGIHSVYVDILSCAQSNIGEMWHNGEINIGVEHLATGITLDIMNELRSKVSTYRKSNGCRAVITPVEGDTHILGSRMLSDFLIIDGWEVDFMGGPIPIEDLVKFVKNRSVDMVGISITNAAHITNVQSTIRALKSIIPNPKILIGGLAMDDSKIDLKSFRGDAVALNIFEGVAVARNLVGLTDKGFTLEEHLAALGSRIRTERLENQMTQQDLATASELDRTYISALEQGKQNVTFGAVLRIAKALNISLPLLGIPLELDISTSIDRD
jgi:methanogenic corrinoid protein MtbC1/DNA-binding XRE family transcriptional regulator